MLRRQRHLPISTRTATRSPGESPLRPRAGLTLVEMMVAVVILAVGLLGMVSTSAYVVRQIGGGSQQTLAASVAQSRAEWIRSMPCDKITDSSTTTRGVKERWVPLGTSNRVLQVLDSVTYSVAGSNFATKTQVYRIMVPCW